MSLYVLEAVFLLLVVGGSIRVCGPSGACGEFYLGALKDTELLGTMRRVERILLRNGLLLISEHLLVLLSSFYRSMQRVKLWKTLYSGLYWGG